jgi:hypothetical protein
MHKYSSFFSTLYDQKAPVGHFGRGTHYSILRAVIPVEDEVNFHDFVVIWDEDHDERIIWFAEKLYAKSLLTSVLAIGERKGGITVLTTRNAPKNEHKTMCSVFEAAPSDYFSLDIGVFPDNPETLINENENRVRNYLAGIHALWTLGSKPGCYTTKPFDINPKTIPKA